MTAVVSAVVAALLVASLVVNYVGVAVMMGKTAQGALRTFWREDKAVAVGAVGLFVVAVILGVLGYWLLVAVLAAVGVALTYWRGPWREVWAGVVAAIGSPGFWQAFWASFAAAIVNTLAPLLLVPFSPAAGWSWFIVNASWNWMAIPFRGGILLATLKAREAT